MDNPRQSWDSYFMDMAYMTASRGTCASRKVGCVLVRDNRILVGGFNGAPPGLPHCIDVGCEMEDGRYIRSVHAEQNAIMQAATTGVTIQGCDVYTTCRPCRSCILMLIGIKVRTIFYDSGYVDDYSQSLLEKAGIVLRCIKPSKSFAKLAG